MEVVDGRGPRPLSLASIKKQRSGAMLTPRGDKGGNRVQKKSRLGLRQPFKNSKIIAKSALKKNKENTDAAAQPGANFKPTDLSDWGSPLKAFVLKKPPVPPAEAPEELARPTQSNRLSIGTALGQMSVDHEADQEETAPVSCSPDAASSLDQLGDFDWDHVILDDWSFAFNGSRPFQLTGRVFNGPAGGFDDGDALEYTSQVTEMYLLL